MVSFNVYHIKEAIQASNSRSVVFMHLRRKNLFWAYCTNPSILT